MIGRRKFLPSPVLLHGAVAMVVNVVSVVALLWLLVVADFADGRRLRYDQHDALSVARCEARCWFSTDKSSCKRNCLLEEVGKPGRCPENVVNMSPFAAVCMETCHQDGQCAGVQKCCRHACGVTCQPPEDLLSAAGLPDIPRDVKVTEGRKKKTIYIEWKPGGHQPYTGTVLFLVEERHHAGRNFIEKRLSDWMPCARSAKPSHLLRNFVKPGRWYQFRVAAVNGNGTKGYSASSPTFGISRGPKPPRAPQNVTVGPLLSKNGTLIAELRWSPPSSDLPIQKYKVFWSRRLHGATALDSVLVHQQVVLGKQTKFLLQNLQPNSLYFLQIQALVQFGKERLKGEKSGLVLNTTNYTNITDQSISLDLNSKSRIEKLKLQKLFWAQDDLRARIAWMPKRGASVLYTVSWWTGPCQQNYKTYTHLKLAATTKTSHFDLYRLQFNCRYRIGVREVSSEGMKSMHDTFYSFTTPTCENFKSSINNKKIRCVH